MEGQGAQGTFNPYATANELGVYTLMGWTYSCVPDAAYPFPTGLVQHVRRAFDPEFVLLWCRAEYRSPNGGRVRVGHYTLARSVRNPHADPVDKVTMTGRYQTGMLLPTLPPERHMYHQPIVVSRPLDGLLDEERKTGKFLPHYEPFDMGCVHQLHWAKWVREKFTPEEVIEALEQADKDREEARRKKLVSITNYQRRNDKDHRQYQAGKRVFVSDRLSAYREIAGATVSSEGVAL